MRIKLLIATAEVDYAEHLSNILSEKYADIFTVSVCSSAERLKDLLAANSYDAALIEQSFETATDLKSIRMPLELIDESGTFSDSNLKKVRKYQRVSAIAGTVMECFADVGKQLPSFHASKARITVSWAPSGGVGKTTVALAYAAQKVLSGKQTTYLNLEDFSSTSTYFQEGGKSISKAFEKLESNLQMFLRGIRRQDGGSGISYFCGPDNYDDMNILSSENIETLINACAVETDELVVDLSSRCDKRVQSIFELADTVLLVCDPSASSQVRLRQFMEQHNVFGSIEEKTVLINNKGAKTPDTGISRKVHLPIVQSADPISVYKTLSSGNFDW